MKKHNIKLLITAFLVGVVAIFGLGTNGVANAKRLFAVSPMYQRVLLTPGETYKGSLEVSNPANADSDFKYIAEVSSYYPEKIEGEEDDYGGVNYTDKTDANMMVDWMKIENPTGTLSTNESSTIVFSIDVPKDAPAGGQYAAILVREDPEVEEIEENTSAVVEIMQMAHVIYAEVAGETIKNGEILENSIPSFLLNNELKTSAKVRNTGNVHVDAEFILQVWPLFSDEEICTNEENAGKSLIVPNTERLHSETCNLPAVGIFRAKQTVRIFGEESVVEKMVIVCPLWLMLIILIIIVALVAGLVFLIRKNKKPAEA